MGDPTENTRRKMVQKINSEADGRVSLVEEHGRDNVWNTLELQQVFTVHSFMAPYVSVTRKSDGKKGSVMFQPRPRFYYNFQEL